MYGSIVKIKAIIVTVKSCGSTVQVVAPCTALEGLPLYYILLNTLTLCLPLNLCWICFCL